MITATNLIEIELTAERRHRILSAAREVVLLEWFGKKIAAHFNQSFEAEMFRRRYRAFLTHGVPEIISCAVSDEKLEPTFFAVPGRAWRYPSIIHEPGAIAFLADAITQDAYFGLNERLTSFHAAAVRIDEVGVAISATSTGGKTTTALACARRGMPLYSDERCVLADGRVYAFPRALNVRAGGLALLSSEDVAEDGGIGDRLRARVAGDWELVAFHELFPDGLLPRPAPLECIFFTVGKSQSPRVERLRWEDALQMLMTSAFCGPRPGWDRLSAAAALLHKTHAYALTLGRPDETALLIATTTRRAQPLASVARQ